MSIISESSISHLITAGKYEGRICNVRRYFFKNMDMDTGAHVAFADFDCNDTATVMAEHLTEIEPPGWILTEREYERRCSSSYGLREWSEREKGTGSNLLRTPAFAQPRALRIGDRLVYGETVEKIRTGYNSSVIIKLNRSGWIELAPRLPIALLGNKHFSLPRWLAKHDRLATGCSIIEKSNGFRAKVGWINIYPDLKGISLEVPYCIPLALV